VASVEVDYDELDTVDLGLTAIFDCIKFQVHSIPTPLHVKAKLNFQLYITHKHPNHKKVSQNPTQKHPEKTQQPNTAAVLGSTENGDEIRKKKKGQVF